MLQGISFLLLKKLDSNKFLIEINKNCNVAFTSVIPQNTTVGLSYLIETHMKRFGKHFPESYVTPKQHYTIHIPSYMSRLGPPT